MRHSSLVVAGSAPVRERAREGAGRPRRGGVRVLRALGGLSGCAAELSCGHLLPALTRRLRAGAWVACYKCAWPAVYGPAPGQPSPRGGKWSPT